MPTRAHNRRANAKEQAKQERAKERIQEKANRVHKPQISQEEFISQVQRLMRKQNLSQAEATHRISKNFEIKF